MNKEKILVTGSNGFIGGHIFKRLVEHGFDVTGFDNFSTSPIWYKEGQVYMDVCGDKWTNEEFDIIFHTAAIARIPRSYDEPYNYYKNNLMSTLNILEYMRIRPHIKMVFSSSSSVKHDTSPYAISKKMCEDMIKSYVDAYDLNVQILRYYNVYGEGMSRHPNNVTAIEKFFICKERYNPITIYGDGTQRRDFTYVGDVVEANIKALDNDVFGIYDVGTGQSYSINEIAELFGCDIRYKKGFVGTSETIADPNNFLNGWRPTTNVTEWIKSQL